VSRNLKNTTNRALRSLGEQIVVHNYGRDGDTDKYGDEARIERASSPHEDVPAQADTSGKYRTERDEAATRPSKDYMIYLDADHAAVENLAGGADPAPRSHIERQGGETVAVLGAIEQDNGLVAAAVEVLV